MKEFDESKHKRDELGCFAKMSAKELSEELKQEVSPNEYGIINLEDEQLPIFIGAMWANEEIAMPDGTVAKFAEGSKIFNKQVFVGKGCKRKIDCVDILVSKYGGKENEWKKVKGVADIVTSQVEEIRCEIHWYEEPNVGRVEAKYKKLL